MTKVVELTEANPNFQWVAAQSRPTMIPCCCQHSLSCFWLPCSTTSLTTRVLFPGQHGLGEELEHVRHSRVPGIQGSIGKCKVVVRKPKDTVGSQRDTELTLKHSEEFLTGMIHTLKPLTGESRHLETSFSWHFAQHYMSSIRWLQWIVGETRPRCATKQDLHPRLHITAAPFKYTTTVALHRLHIPERFLDREG